MLPSFTYHEFGSKGQKILTDWLFLRFAIYPLTVQSAKLRKEFDELEAKIVEIEKWQDEKVQKG